LSLGYFDISEYSKKNLNLKKIIMRPISKRESSLLKKPFMKVLTQKRFKVRTEQIVDRCSS
jgi:hypothetical protein